MSDEPKITRSLTREQWDRVLLRYLSPASAGWTRCRWPECSFEYYNNAGLTNEDHTGTCPLAEKETDSG